MPGTSAARGPYPRVVPERSGLSRRSRKRSRTPPPQVACLWRRRPACACSRDGCTTNLPMRPLPVEIPILSAVLPVRAPLRDVCDRKTPLGRRKATSQNRQGRHLRCTRTMRHASSLTPRAPSREWVGNPKSEIRNPKFLVQSWQETACLISCSSWKMTRPTRCWWRRF